jgi:hypothetical protein
MGKIHGVVAADSVLAVVDTDAIMNGQEVLHSFSASVGLLAIRYGHPLSSERLSPRSTTAFVLLNGCLFLVYSCSMSLWTTA